MLANLFVCHTPLQALIAQNLIQTHSQAPADLLMFSSPKINNDKFHHYFQTTAALCRHANYHIIPQKKHHRFFALPQLTQSLATHYRTVFIASIDSINAQYPLSKIQFQHIETFDDGTANLLPNSFLYQPPKLTRRLANLILNIPYQTQDLRRLSQCHHTLFPNHPNITTPTKPIKLWHTPIISSPTKTQTLFLGQPIFSQQKYNQQLSEYIIKEFNIQHYFPHPRESLSIPTVHTINTPLIFEDWLLQQIKINPHTQYHIYHLTSTAAINTHQFPNAQIYSIQPNHPTFRQPIFKQLYQLMQQLNISIQTLDIPKQLISA